MNNFRIKPIILLFMLCGIYKANAQGENNHWHFGYNHHVDFNAATPQYNTNSSMTTFESSATVSDAQGNLLFYTIGCRVWDRNGAEMPNATGLLGNYSVGAIPAHNGSGSDCVQTLPNPSNPNQYFVFSIKSQEEGCDKIYYHTVDMTLNGGLGDVIAATKNTILLQTPQTFGIKELSAVTYGDCNSYWFIATMGQQYGFAYYAYKVDANGVSTTPVISTPNLPLNFAMLSGQLKILPQTQVSYRTTLDGVLRANFNKLTGVFSNFEMIPNTPGYRIEHSPNEQVLYMNSPNGVRQYNLALYPNLAAIGASATIIAPGNEYYDMRLGPDGKIYVVTPSPGALARIEQPDVLGTACTYTPSAISLQQFPSNVMRLGATTLRFNVSNTVYTTSQTINQLCDKDTITLSGIEPSINNYVWSTGSFDTEIKVTQPGTYWVEYKKNDCESYRDTFIVKRIVIPDLLGNDTTICTGHQLTFNAAQPALDNYLWSDGSTGSSLTINQAGTYTVTAWTGYCEFRDSIKVDTITARLNLPQPDTLICAGSPLYLSATTNMGSTIHWNNGHTGSSMTVYNAGVYKAYTENKCGMQTDSVRVTEMDCKCRPITPNAFTPNGDGRNDIFMPVFNPDCEERYYEMRIYNRYGQLVYMTNRRGTGWDGTYATSQKPADAGVYFYTISLSNRYGDTDQQLIKGDITLVR